MKKIIRLTLTYHPVFLLVLLALFTGSCKKDKFSNNIPLLNVGNQSASSIRMFNFSGYAAQVTVNNIPLTSYATGGGTPQGTPLGLSLFPSGVWTAGDDGSPFTLPNSLVDKDSKAHFIITPQTPTTTGVTVDTSLVNDIAHPKDYYLMLDGTFKVIDREILPPSNPQNFKIRIINLGAAVDPMELNGPVSMTYADGSPVDPVLNNVALGSISAYAEVPYGTYQFKLFASAGAAIRTNRQLAELPTTVRLDPCAMDIIQPQEGLGPRVRTFKPGGVYTMVITSNLMNYIGCDGYPNGFYANSYRVITEMDPGTNNTYARMQAVNAIPGKQVTITVDGAPLGDQLPYIGSVTAATAQQWPYQIFVQGNHHIKAADQNGAVLAEGDLKLYPYDNYTIWAYNKPDGSSAILFEANDMSGTVYKPLNVQSNTGQVINDGGTNGQVHRVQYNYALQSRFLNLSPDLPYLTFTNDNQLFVPATGQSQYDTLRYAGAYENLAPGIMPERNSSIIYVVRAPTNDKVQPYYESPPAILRAYQSVPGYQPIVPGTLLTNVAPVNMLQTFIANQQLYSTPKYKVAETGVYTVALVGKTFTATQPGEQARMVVIKHTK